MVGLAATTAVAAATAVDVAVVEPSSVKGEEVEEKSGNTVATFAAPIGIIEPPPEVKSITTNTQHNTTQHTNTYRPNSRTGNHGPARQPHHNHSIAHFSVCSSLSACLSICVSVVIDRTAEFVRKTGGAGEEQLLAKNRNNRKFAFLTPQSPFHTYYKHRVAVGSGADSNTAAEDERKKEEEERREKERVEREEEEARQRSEREQKAIEDSKPRTLQQRLQLKIEATRLDGQTPANSSNPSPPASAVNFHISHPSHYSSSDLDVIHLTALYASHLGGGFISSLQQRERTNAAFDFLKPQHPLYSYYVGTRQAMDRILRQQTGSLLAEYTKCLQQPSHLLARLLDAARLRRQKQVEEDARQREAQEDSEVMSAIDWQSFVVVETVEFTAEEEMYLPQPKQSVEEMEALIAELVIEEERDKEERERQEAERREREKREHEAMQMEAAAAAEAAASMPQPPATSSTAGGVVIQHSDELLEVRTSAVPVAASVAAAAGVSNAPTLASKLVTCVLCKDTIAAEDLEEHLRIELLDPKWRVQKQQLVDRQRETSLVAGKSISDNLRRFERKKREIGRERSREEEERQEREDALLLRGAARHDTAQPSASSTASPPSSTGTSAASAASSAAPVPLTSLPPASDEPLPKRARPSSPSPTAPVTPSTATSAASSTPTASLQPSVLRSSPRPDSTMAMSASSPFSSSASADSSAAAEPPSSVDSAVAVAPSTASPAPAPKAPSAQLVDESVWLSAHPMELTVLIRVPVDPTSPFQLTGQELPISCRLLDTIDVFKAAVSAQCNALPANRQQFQLLTGTFLKEGHSLAYYNVYDGAVLTLKLKERGGKRK